MPIVKQKAPRSFGAIYTPPDLAQFLTNFAIKRSSCVVLDLGTGQGNFVFPAYDRIVSLGADPQRASEQIYGAEIDDVAFAEFELAAEQRKLQFPKVRNIDFFDLEIPELDAVIGNPPYVRRSSILDIDSVREKSVVFGQSIEFDVSRLSDLYVYFLLRAINRLKPGGRIAVVTADPWLSVGYGHVLRQLLLSQFRIESLISIDRPIFADAQVKPVLLLAEKVGKKYTGNVKFVRVKNGLPIADLNSAIKTNTHPDVKLSHIESSTLVSNHPWNIHFKAPDMYERIVASPRVRLVSDIADTQIGYQTLAKEFFVLSAESAESKKIETHYLAPLAQSAHYIPSPVISDNTPKEYFLFYCADEKEQLENTYALRHIEQAEATPVKIRGKEIVVVGYHNKDRIKEAGRKNWYDLRSNIERRVRGEILIPRLVYKDFMVYWNKARWIPGELFIEFIPKSKTSSECYLAILNSSISEVLFRCHAQVYGGGTYNMNAGEIKNLPIIDPSQLTQYEVENLIQAYRVFLDDRQRGRRLIDDVVFSILRFDDAAQSQTMAVVEDLVTIATATKHRKSK